jgi:hypothetical protein
MFKVGDKVRCVSTGYNRYLTVDKVYCVEGISDWSGGIKIVNDHDGTCPYPPELFELVQPAKEEKVMFKVGDKVRCVSVGYSSYLTVGKIYSVITSDSTGLVVQTDGTIMWYAARLFELVNEPKTPTREEVLEYINKRVSSVYAASGNINAEREAELRLLASALYGVQFEVAEKAVTTTVKEVVMKDVS